MTILEKLRPLGLLSLRIALGTIFFFAGYEKLFVSPALSLAEFQRLGLPAYFGQIAGVVELFGGILLFFGLLTRVTALLLTIETGLVLVKLQIPQAGLYAVQKYELPL